MPTLDRWPEDTLTPTSVVFEVGAYRGDWVVEIARHCNPFIYAFEPAPLAFKYLKEKTEEYSGVAPFNFGLSNVTKDVLLYDCERDGANFFESRPGHKNTIASLVDIAEFIEDYGIGHIDLMRINIEGGEFDLLNRMIDTDIIDMVHFLMVQWHWDKENPMGQIGEMEVALGRKKVLHPSNAAWGIWVPKQKLAKCT